MLHHWIDPMLLQAATLPILEAELVNYILFLGIVDFRNVNFFPTITFIRYHFCSPWD